jgi:RNA polymerase primary sigma factor
MIERKFFPPLTDEMMLSEEQVQAIAVLEATMLENKSAQKSRDHLAADDVFGQYLKDIANNELLSAADELTLGKAIALGKIAQEHVTIFNSQEQEVVDGLPTDQHEILVYLTFLHEIILQAEVAKEILFHFNTRLVISVAKAYLNQNRVPFEDLVQEGNIGLLKAIKRYEYERELRFSTYATWWIRQAISVALADQGRTIRVPLHQNDKIRFVKRVRVFLANELSRYPTYAEIAIKANELKPDLNLDANDIVELERIDQNPASLNAPLNEDPDSDEYGDRISTDEESVESQTENTLLKNLVQEALNSEVLTDKEATVLRMRFGLDTGKAMTLEDVGAVIGVTRERIRQLEARAIFKLRKSNFGKQFKDFLS